MNLRSNGFRKIWAMIPAAVWVGLPAGAKACAVCVGDPDSPLTQGMVAGVLFLLIVVLGVLSGITGFFLYLVANQRRYAETGNELGSFEPLD